MSSKLHIPSPTPNKPLCGRQLVNDRTGRTQTDAGRSLAGSLDEYLAALSKRKACRHCGREAGIIPKIIRSARQDSNEEQTSED